MENQLETAGNQLEGAFNRYLDVSLAMQKSRTREDPNIMLPDLALVDRIRELTLYEQRVQEVKVTVAMARNCSTTVVSIHRLSPSILARIFHEVVISETCNLLSLTTSSTLQLPKHSIRLTHVCTHWRQIAITSPNLWSHIDISSSILKSEKLLPRIRTFLFRAGRSLLNLHVEYSVSPDGDENTPSLDNFIASLAPRIQGVECCIKHNWTVPELRASQSAMSSFLNNTHPGDLTMLDVSVDGGAFDFHIQTAEQKPDVQSLPLDMTNHYLEALLLPVTILRLNGIYPHWASKAFHGLIELRLHTPNRFQTIHESELITILIHSPQLRIFELGIQIEFADTPSKPITLHHLEVLLTHTPSYSQLGKFFRLLDTGSSSLFISLDSPHVDDQINDNLVHFFSHANITRLCAVQFPKFSKALELANLTHTIKRFAMNPPSIDPEWFEELDSVIQVHLNTMYFLGSMGLDINQLRGIIDWSGVRKLVLWGEIYRATHNGRPIMSEQFLKKELSDLGVVVEVLEASLPSPLNNFLL